MTDNLTRSFLASSSIPFEIASITSLKDYELIKTRNNEEYLCRFVTEKEYQTYLELIRYTKRLKQAIYETRVSGGFLLFFEYENMTEAKVKSDRIIHILREIHESSSFEITLKKEHLVNINNIFKVLDNKFSYLEMRIREIETNPVKNDVSWVILSKYNIILDAKIYLYDLQTDIFKAIDKKHIVPYGLLYRNIDIELYNKQRLLPSFDLYYAPISMLYCRCYLQLDAPFLIEEVKRLDSFNQKYFCFMCLYIMILNVNLEVILNTYSIANYLLLTKKIRCFIASFKEIMEK
ncbi:MAG: hypothetical protein NC310_09125 [Roseburia sp.]|nr:hypothetical protein [Roseburia sp.]MCM1557906.1 hypothetical protein [Anaeroplasma bactoclasticum]